MDCMVLTLVDLQLDFMADFVWGSIQRSIYINLISVGDHNDKTHFITLVLLSLKSVQPN